MQFSLSPLQRPIEQIENVTGRIIYTEERVKRLGWKETAEEARIGMIVYIKSSLLKNEKELRTDVRQCGIENLDFPQQSGHSH